MQNYILEKLRYIKYLKNSFKISLKSFEEYSNIYKFEESILKKSYFNNLISSSRLNEISPYPVLVSSSSGLSIIKDNKIFNILNTFNGFYVFGIICTKKKLIVSVNFHLPVKSRFDLLINKRLTLLIATDIKNINNVINGKLSKIDWEIILEDSKKNYSYLNYFENKLYCADYLGTIDEFDLNENTNSLKKLSTINLLKSINKSPLYFYPFLHLNCISIDQNYIYVGSHAYSRMTKFGSSLYKANKITGEIELERENNFISGHDMMIINNDFYGVDSENQSLFKNDKCIFKSKEKSFLRGLSINNNGYVCGSSVFFENRNNRMKKNKNNKILYLNKNGSLICEIKINISSIYNIFALNSLELTQSSPIPLNLSF